MHLYDVEVSQHFFYEGASMYVLCMHPTHPVCQPCSICKYGTYSQAYNYYAKMQEIFITMPKSGIYQVCTQGWLFINIWNFNISDLYYISIVKFGVPWGELRLCQLEQAHKKESFELISEAIGLSSFLTFPRPPSRPEAKNGQLFFGWKHNSKDLTADQVS